MAVVHKSKLRWVVVVGIAVLLGACALAKAPLSGLKSPVNVQQKALDRKDAGDPAEPAEPAEPAISGEPAEPKEAPEPAEKPEAP